MSEWEKSLNFIFHLQNVKFLNIISIRSCVPPAFRCLLTSSNRHRPSLTVFRLHEDEEKRSVAINVEISTKCEYFLAYVEKMWK